MYEAVGIPTCEKKIICVVVEMFESNVMTHTCSGWMDIIRRDEARIRTG